jgi:hypothetical protein
VGSRRMRNRKARSGLCAGQAVSQAHARIRGAVKRGQASSTRDKNRMREFRTYGSVRGVPSNGHPYRAGECRELIAVECPFIVRRHGRLGSIASIRFVSPRPFEQLFMLAGVADP